MIRTIIFVLIPDNTPSLFMIYTIKPNVSQQSQSMAT